jgi:hypothetical protein
MFVNVSYRKLYMQCFVISGTCCPYVLKQAAIPVLDTRKCNETSHLAGQITDNMFCAGYNRGGIDACHVSYTIAVH